MKIYAVMPTAYVQDCKYNNLFVTEDKDNNLVIGPEVFSSKEEAEEWLNLHPKKFRNWFTIVELGFRSIDDYKKELNIQ